MTYGLPRGDLKCEWRMDSPCPWLGGLFNGLVLGIPLNYGVDGMVGRKREERLDVQGLVDPSL